MNWSSSHVIYSNELFLSKPKLALGVLFIFYFNPFLQQRHSIDQRWWHSLFCRLASRDWWLGTSCKPFFIFFILLLDRCLHSHSPKTVKLIDPYIAVYCWPRPCFLFVYTVSIFFSFSFRTSIYFSISIFTVTVTLPKNLQILPASPSKSSRRSMQSPYRLPTPLPPLPVRKGIRGRRPKSETIALLKAVAVAAAAQNEAVPKNTQLIPRVHKKRGPKPGSKVRLLTDLYRFVFPPHVKYICNWTCIFQRKPKILHHPAQLPSIQVPQENTPSLNSVVSTGKDSKW